MVETWKYYNNNCLSKGKIENNKKERSDIYKLVYYVDYYDNHHSS